MTASPLRLLFGLIALALCSSNLAVGQSSPPYSAKSNELYIVCSLVDDPHKTVYYSGVFKGVESKVHIYEKSFSTYLEMTHEKVIGTAKCLSYQQESSAKAGLASLQENWHWVYKTSIPTYWMNAPRPSYSTP